jgi:hypothetical protein
MFIGIRIIRGADLLFSQSVKFTAKTTVQPIQVDQDAKLEYFEIDHTYRTSLELGGSTQAFSRISLKTTYHGHTRVTYPGAEYDPTNTDVEVRLDISGVDEAHELREEEFDQSLKAKPEADKNFAAEVDKVIGKLAQREQDWNQPNHCASIKFDPASETLTLEKGNTGSVGVKLEAKRGGAPQGAKWTLGDRQNATIAPDKALANPAAFNYTVTNAGEGIEVRGTWKAVSQAGVAEGTWVQKTRKPRPPPAKKFAGPVSGTAQYDSSLLGEGNSLDAEWSGNVTLKQEPPLFEIPGVPITSWNYKLVSGSITYSFSGSIGECHVEGSEPIDLGAQFDLTSSFSLTIMEGEPRPYQFFLPMPLFAKVNGTASACKDPEDEGPTEFIPAAGIPAIVNAPLTLGGTLAADESFSGSNSGDTGGGTPDQTWQWAMAPVP